MRKPSRTSNPRNWKARSLNLWLNRCTGLPSPLRWLCDTPDLSKGPNSGVSAAALMRAQQTHGNRSVQRMIADAQPQTSEGERLSPPATDFLESRFGTSLGGVRIHTDAAAARSADALSAEAYTAGEHIYFGREKHGIITRPGRTYPWKRIRRRVVRCSRRILGRWSRCRKLAVFIICANVRQRDNWLRRELPRPVTT